MGFVNKFQTHSVKQWGGFQPWRTTSNATVLYLMSQRTCFPIWGSSKYINLLLLWIEINCELVYTLSKYKLRKTEVKFCGLSCMVAIEEHPLSNNLSYQLEIF